VVFAFIEDLDDIAIRLRIHDSKNVCARQQDLPGDLNRATEGKDGFLVPVVRFSLRESAVPRTAMHTNVMIPLLFIFEFSFGWARFRPTLSTAFRRCQPGVDASDTLVMQSGVQ
jgi:hypothetical protein